MNGIKWLFAINPRAGRKKRDVRALLRELAPAAISYDLLEWTDQESLSKICFAIRSGNYDVIVAAGGDGTVNRVAQEVIGTEMTLGVLPLGSGNGLARSLGMGMDPREALRQLFQRRVGLIDTATVNDRLFLCTAGVGFDAHIGGLFAQSEKRGLRRYVSLVMREFMKYNPDTYQLTVDGVTNTTHAFLVTVANAGQYGNDFYIAPEARLNDGVLHVVVLRPFHFLRTPGLLKKILLKQTHLSDSISTQTAKEVIIRRASPGLIHCDGEPINVESELVFRIRPASLKVLEGPSFKGG